MRVQTFQALGTALIAQNDERLSVLIEGNCTQVPNRHANCELPSTQVVPPEERSVRAYSVRFRVNQTSPEKEIGGRGQVRAEAKERLNSKR
jgi:hypothetical protein